MITHARMRAVSEDEEDDTIPQCKPPLGTPEPADEDDEVGVRCPKCHSRLSNVLATRGRSFGRIWRRRECYHCGHRYSTREVIDEGPGTRRPKF
jgi:DNA-directed RNA polymerase subunit M/transcription elongation factor TFIIS